MTTTTPILAVTSDWHLARSAYARRPILGDSACALEAVVARCRDLGVPLLAAGDLFDTRDPHPDDVRAARRQMDRMRKADLAVYFTQGQHELRDPPWLAAIHGWPAHLHGRCVALRCGLRLRGLDYTRGPELAAALAGLPDDFDALACHQVWSELMGGGAGDHVGCEGRLVDVPRGDLVLTGDYHEHRRLDLTRDDGSALVVLSPGSLCMQSIDEPAAKAFWLLGRDAAGDLVAESVPIPSRPVLRLEARSAADLADLAGGQLASRADAAAAEAAAAGLPEGLRAPLVEVRLPAGLEAAKDRLLAAAEGRCHLFLKERAGSAAVAAARERLSAARGRGLLGVLAAMEGVPDRARRDVAALLECPDDDAEAVLEAIVGAD